MDIGYSPRHTEGINNIFWSVQTLKGGLSGLNCHGMFSAFCYTPAHRRWQWRCPAELRELGQQYLRAARVVGALEPRGQVGSWAEEPRFPAVSFSCSCRCVCSGRGASGCEGAGAGGGRVVPAPAAPRGGSIDCALEPALPPRARAGRCFSLVEHRPCERLIAMQMYL